MQLMDVASTFRSPGSEWERDHLVDIVSNVAVQLKFNDVLERAFVVAQDAKNVWERASALSHVGNAYAMAGDKPRAMSIAHCIEDTVAEGLRNQFPRRHVRGAILLASTVSAAHSTVGGLSEESVVPRYLAVPRALTCSREATVPEERDSLISIVQRLSKWEVATIPLYVLLKKAVVDRDVDALATVEHWERESFNATSKSTIRVLRVLATTKDPKELVETAHRVVDSYDNLGVIPEAALAVVDPLATAGMPEAAAAIVDRLRDSAQRPRADANQQVSWEAAAFVASQRQRGGAVFQEPLIALLDHARDVGMLSAARTLADTAPTIAALFDAQSTLDLLGPTDEAATPK